MRKQIIMMAFFTFLRLILLPTFSSGWMTKNHQYLMSFTYVRSEERAMRYDLEQSGGNGDRLSRPIISRSMETYLERSAAPPMTNRHFDLKYNKDSTQPMENHLHNSHHNRSFWPLH